MKNVKTCALLLSCLLVLSLFAGCGGSTGTTSQPAAQPAASGQPAATPDANAAAAPYELSVAWWGGEARHQKTLEMIDLYMKKFPEATVVSQYAAYTDYWTKMSTQAAAGNMPDAYLVQLSYIGEYASKGLMRPLQDLIDAGKIDVSNYTSGALSSSSYNGQVVGITFGDTGSCLAYNKGLLDSVGIEPPKDQMLYSEFADYLKKLAQALPEGSVALESAAKHDYAVDAYVRQLGGYGLLSEDGKSLGYTKEMLAQLMSYYVDLFNAGVSGSKEVILDDRDKQFGDSLTGNGKTAIWYTNCNQVKIFQATIEDELGMARTPVVDGFTNQYVEVAVPSTWAIYGKSQKVDQAAQFISHMVNDWDLQSVYDMDIGVPGSTVIQGELIAKLDPSNKVDNMKKREIELMQDILSTIEPFNGRSAGYGAALDDFKKKMDEALFGSMTVEQAVDAHFAATQTMLA